MKFLDKVLCRLGIHAFGKWASSEVEIPAVTRVKHQQPNLTLLQWRECKVCNWAEARRTPIK